MNWWRPHHPYCQKDWHYLEGWFQNQYDCYWSTGTDVPQPCYTLRCYLTSQKRCLTWLSWLMMSSKDLSHWCNMMKRPKMFLFSEAGLVFHWHFQVYELQMDFCHLMNQNMSSHWFQTKITKIISKQNYILLMKDSLLISKVQPMVNTKSWRKIWS